MNITIKNKNGDIIITGAYESIKHAVSKNRANLRDADLYGAILRGADLYGADLRDANLRGAILCDADLRDAILCGADLCGADLRDANLRGADLRDANLRGAILCDADLDFSVLSFSCRSLKCKTNEKQRIQLMFHALSWMAYAESITDEEKAIYNLALDYANKFHRSDVGRLIKKED